MTNDSEQFVSKPARKKVKKVIEISSSEDDEDTQAATADLAKKRKVSFTAQVKVSSKKVKSSSCAKKSTTTAPGPRKPDRDQLLYILEGGGEEDARKMTLKSAEKVSSSPSTKTSSNREAAAGVSSETGAASADGEVVVKRVKSGGSTVIVDEDNSISLDLREIEKIVGHSMKDSRMVVVFKNAPPVKSGGNQKDKEHKDQVTNSTSTSPFKTSDTPTNGATDDAPFIHKRRYKDAFDKYFLEETAVCEHNDSLESESSEEEETYMFPIKNSSKTNSGKNSRKTETKMTVVQNLMEEVTTDLPHWVAHSRPGSSKFWLARLELEDSSVSCIVPKFIEFDEEFNAKTYVDQKLVESFSGVYDSYEAVKNLLYSVDRYENVH